ncbi:unnamed protein product [Eruca vesicaria subsp. sativa]|uniref:AB hydrolase-1 domain-containing protein n=1 Tax=Eruca vesicaria subsp. sativa TaxID=29727 RepID=A0ABC8IUN3_ERUVS|nr:unnamed protein product [Eruca vesicaria subsp. sativa]
MAAVSCSTASSSGGCGLRRSQLKTCAFTSLNFSRTGPNSQSDRLSMAMVHGNRKARGTTTIRMALVDERQSTCQNIVDPPRILAYDLVQGALVKWRWKEDKSVPDTPTALLLHGILGCGKNWGTFARRLAHEFPTWQFLMVDLRCHGDSASLKKRGPHSVATTASDVLKLVSQLKLTPRVLVGHSFGGKVVLSMVEQAAKPLPRPVRAWVLDATPGKVRAGGDREDHPRELISFLRTLPTVVLYYNIHSLSNGCSTETILVCRVQWVITNLRPTGPSCSSFSWTFDLDGISQLYQSYEDTNLW